MTTVCSASNDWQLEGMEVLENLALENLEVLEDLEDLENLEHPVPELQELPGARCRLTVVISRLGHLLKKNIESRRK